MDKYIKFAFLTGVTKFGKVSVFSDLNNLLDISMDEAYTGICGITEGELTTYFKEDIHDLAVAQGMTDGGDPCPPEGEFMTATISSPIRRVFIIRSAY